SRQGRIFMVNRGPMGRGFRVCESCGFGQPAPEREASEKLTKPPTHDDPRRPGPTCGRPLSHRHLGHHYLTDVVEVRLDHKMDGDTAISTLYALLEGVEALGISRDDVDGALYHWSRNDPPALVIFDRVPGGAGHAQRIAGALPE